MTEPGKLGKYEIRRELGKGAMGVVYEGFDPMIERVVAIKTIRPEQLDRSQAEDVLARFRREAQAAGRLNHPHIVSIYEYGEDAVAGGGTVAYIAMEYIKGRELKDYFDANERFPAAETVRIMGELLDALEHAHANGVVHRDMKPANVILLQGGGVKVADFGIARIETSELTQAGTILGTPSYMSPEQFLGQPVDGRSDLFSCGVILYQFLTGEKPFTGAVTTIMHKVLKEEPLAPSMLNATLPPAWDAVVKKSMAKNPADRYQRAADFAAAVRAAAERREADATVVDLDPDATLANDDTALDRPGPPRSPPAASQAPAAAGQPSRKGSGPGAMIAIGAALLVVLGGGTYLMLGKDRAAGEAPVYVPATPAPAAPTAAAPTAGPAQPVASAAPVPGAAAPAAPAAIPAEPPAEPGTMVISALGLVDPKNPMFKGDQAAAQTEARADAKRQLVEKAIALYVSKASLDGNYALIERKLLPNAASFIKTVIQEGAPQVGKDGLIAAETRATVNVREVQKFLNRMSKEERVDFIRNNGDPKISVRMSIGSADTAQALPAGRSLLAENILKERIKSFGFRVWSAQGETKTAPGAKEADFEIQGEVKVKQLSARLAASGITVSKTALTSWTIKAIDKASGEEIYLNTAMPKAQSWATEDQALESIGKLVGEEFSKSFFMQHFNFGQQKTGLLVSGLPDAQSARLLLREFRGIRQVLDARLVAESGRYELRLAEGNAADIVQDAILGPLNAKFGQSCFALAGATAAEVNVSFSAACAQESVRAKLEAAPPAGLLSAPESRGKALLHGGASKTST